MYKYSTFKNFENWINKSPECPVKFMIGIHFSSQEPELIEVSDEDANELCSKMNIQYTKSNNVSANDDVKCCSLFRYYLIL